MPALQTQATDATVVDLEERSWLTAHRRGDPQAFAKLMQAYRKPLYSFLVRQGLEPQLCDDLFQEIFLKIHKSAHQYQASRPLSPWVFTIAVNTLRDHQRKKSVPLAAVTLVEDVVDVQPTPERSADLAATMDWLHQAMGDLPQAQAEALNLSLVKGLKIKEIGAVLGLPVNTIKSHLRRAKQTLLSAFQSRQQSHRATHSPSGDPHETL
jgi:RNA polymerase sigma-70 factor (ECF subfamily)